MREIKFRVWYYNGVVLRMGDMQYDVLVNAEGLAQVWDADIKVWSNCVKVMQYTGLKDKNGKEIYEGDLVRSTSDSFHRNGLISWAEEKGGFWYEPIRGKLRQFGCHLESDMVKVLEVIGNVWENSELLEDRK